MAATWLLLIGSVVAAVPLAGVGVAFAIRANGGEPAVVPSTSRSGSASTHRPGPPVEVCLPPDCAAKVTFRPAGDRFVVCDTKEDNLSAVVVYTRQDVPSETTVWASEGEGTCVEHEARLPETTKITFKACTGDKPTNRIVACSEAITSEP